MRKNPLFHVTAGACLSSIRKNGLLGKTTPRNRGETLNKPSIFALVSSDENLAADVALNQIWPGHDVDDYALVTIDPAGIRGRVRLDQVAEFSAPWQRVIEQAVMEPRFLTAEIRHLGFPGRKILEMQCRGFFKRPFTAEEWKIARRWFHPEMIQLQQEWERGHKRSRRRAG